MKDESKCACCLRPAQGNHSIHRDGFGEGPEVPLCDDCGQDAQPSATEIWDRIAVHARARGE